MQLLRSLRRKPPPLMRNDERPRVVDQPEPGFFELRLVRGGPLVGARIIHEQGWWTAWIDGKLCGPADQDPVRAEGVCRIWNGARRIDRVLYDFRLSTKSWALANEPDHPAANPGEPIDLGRMRSLF